MTLNMFVLRKYWLIFNFCHYFLFFSTSGAVLVRIFRHRFPVGYKIMSLTVLHSTNGLVLIPLVFNFFLILDHTWIFYDLFSCRIFWLLTSPIERKHYREIERKHNREKGEFNCFCYIVYSFSAEKQLSREFFCFYLSFSFFLLLYAIYFISIVLNCFTRTYNST